MNVLATVAVLLGVVALSPAQVNIQFPFGGVKVDRGPNGVKVDVVHPAGTVNVNKPTYGPAKVDVVHPVGRVNIGGDNAQPSGVTGDDADLNRIDLGDLLRSALHLGTALGSGLVDTIFPPGGYANAQKSVGSRDVDVAFPGGSVQVTKTKRAAGDTAITPTIASTGTSKDKDDAPTRQPGSGRRRNNAHLRRRNSQVDVQAPWTRVSVDNRGNNNVDVQYPGGFVQLDPREPGKRRTGTVVFPFGSVRFG